MPERLSAQRFQCTGKVVDKFRAAAMVDGCAGVSVLVIDQQTLAAGVVRLHLTCPDAVYELIWKGAEIRWSTRTIYEVISTSPAGIPPKWNELHGDVRFVSETVTSVEAVGHPAASSES